MLRGLFAGMLGVMVSLVGQFDVNNKLRMVPDFLRGDLMDGFALLPVIIGLFAVSQMFEEAEVGMKQTKFEAQGEQKAK